MSIDAETRHANTRPRKMACEPKNRLAHQAFPERQTKTDLVLDLLTRSEGATLEQLVAATGWLPHTARAALSGLRKKGHAVSSTKAEDGTRVYRVARA
jgi:hypothetical protein